MWHAFASAHNVQLGLVFDLFDDGGDGQIDHSEVLMVLEALGKTPTGEEVNAVLAQADANQDGLISRSEFEALLGVVLSTDDTSAIRTDMSDLLRLAQLRRSFRAFDRDDSKLIDEGEFHEVLRALGLATSAEEEQKIMRLSDVDLNGTLDFGEFARLMRDKVDVKSQDVIHDILQLAQVPPARPPSQPPLAVYSRVTHGCHLPATHSNSLAPCAVRAGAQRIFRLRQ